MAEEAAKVGQASLTASETGDLSLTGCQLKKFPDGICLMLKHTQINSVDISINSIQILSAKFFTTFHAITILNISSNKLSDLPDQASLLTLLKILNASHNEFIQIPDSIRKIPSLAVLNLTSNNITNVTTECFMFLPSLTDVTLSDNPLTDTSLSSLHSVTTISIIL
ncbi:hypothetical protein LOD99_11787 [Oopsacas minuta]|uniref:Leucine-rich repeat-containing protein 20 n=1 Tax=Oopsacas minuta TaxID=111878 RepID=A0AAV7JKU7_9METZ|nr:hypothetical protein LOD99_11787 [Oopsacas minuta]